MKMTSQLKLMPTPEQAQLLKQTLERANAACNYISDVAWEQETFRKYALQKLCYQDVKTSYELSAQMVVRCLAKVGDAYTLDKRSKRRFKRHGSIAYDDRILSWNLREPSVSIWTIGGRERIPFVAGERQMKLLESRAGETDLVYRRGNFYLLATCEVEDPEPFVAEGIIGVDLGVKNIATDSDGNIRSSRMVNAVRHRRLRKKLQKKRTHSAKRRLKKLSGKERRFATSTNHANRSSQAVFKCVECGCAGHADSIAAGNIARRAEVMLPNVPDAVSHTLSALPGASPRALAVSS